jgi:hypothetical protein
VHDQLNHFQWLADELESRPTRWAEIVDSVPTFLGTVDASGLGMGGTWLSTNSLVAPLLWRVPFSQELQNSLVSSENLSGTITNSDLEQLALVCHPDVLTSHHDIREHTICALSDNTAAVSRDRRGSTSVNAPSAYLCRLAAIHQRSHRYRLNVDNLPGPLNVMADNLSRRWDLSDSQLLAHFNSVYPQTLSWRLCQLQPALISTAMKALSMQHCDPASLLADRPLPIPTGTSGQTYVCNTNWIPTSPKDPMQCTGSKFSLSEYEQAGFPPPVTQSELPRRRTPSLTLARRIQWPAHAMANKRDPRHVPGSTAIGPQRFSQTRLSTIPSPTHPSSSPPSRLGRRPTAKHGTFDRCHRPNLVGFLLPAPSRRIHHQQDGTTPVYPCDIRLWHHSTPIYPLMASPVTLLSATFVILIFTDQKNAVRGKTVGHGRSGDLQACPVLAVVRRILHLRTPLGALNAIGGSISANAITALLRQGGLAFSVASNVTLTVLHQKALRPTGASALLSQSTSYSTIKLLGRWKSDLALRFLHLQSRMSALAPALR